jgi:hypothetical protein
MPTAKGLGLQVVGNWTPRMPGRARNDAVYLRSGRCHLRAALSQGNSALARGSRRRAT